MLHDLLVAYLSSFKTEAEFYGPFQALLHSMGYSRVQLLHGRNEFGKDVIGRIQGRQWAFQLKHGDLGLGAWREIQGQCLEMFTAQAGHPDFDDSLPLTGCLVVNGRLKGGAMDRPRQFAEKVRQKRLGRFEVWTVSDLAAQLEKHLPALGSHDFALRFGYLEQTLQKGSAGLQEIDRYTTSWWHLCRDHEELFVSILIEACVASRLLESNGLSLFAPYVLLGAIRVWLALNVQSPKKAKQYNALAALLITVFGEQIVRLAADCNSFEKGVDELLVSGFDAHFGVVARGMTLAELICIAVEIVPDLSDASVGQLKALFSTLRQLKVLQLPPSDRYLASVLLTAKRIGEWESREAASTYLKRVALENNNYLNDGGLGLASPYAPAEEEMWRFLAPETEACNYQRRPDTFLASACSDGLLALKDEDALKAVLQDTRAVGGIPNRLVPSGAADSFFMSNESARMAMLHAIHDGVDAAVNELRKHVAQYSAVPNHGLSEPPKLLWVVSLLLRDRWWPALL